MTCVVDVFCVQVLLVITITALNHESAKWELTSTNIQTNSKHNNFYGIKVTFNLQVALSWHKEIIKLFPPSE